MTREDVAQLAERLDHRAAWYERPADFRAGVLEMARCCEEWLLEIDNGPEETSPEPEPQTVRVG